MTGPGDLIDAADAGDHFDAIGLEARFQSPGDVDVLTGHHAWRELEQGDARPERGEDRRQLGPRGRRADDRQRGRQRG
jgi:hypothetical protein